MHKSFYLGLILLYTLCTRLFHLGSIPPLTPDTFLFSRYMNIGISVLIVLLLFIFTYKNSKNGKKALLSAWVYSVLFWPFEQGRIVSPVNLTVLLILVYLIRTIRTSLWPKFTVTLFLIILLPLVYPQLWIFRRTLPVFSLDMIKNLFTVISFEHLFFKNIYFWWGGVRDFGIMNLAFLPFFLVGLFQATYQKEFQILFGSLIIITLTAVSPFFPETRELYLVTPFFSYIIAIGIYKSIGIRNYILKTILGIFYLYFMYELSLYYHFYMVHYLQEVKGNLNQIHETF